MVGRLCGLMLLEQGTEVPCRSQTLFEDAYENENELITYSNAGFDRAAVSSVDLAVENMKQ